MHVSVSGQCWEFVAAGSTSGIIATLSLGSAAVPPQQMQAILSPQRSTAIRSPAKGLYGLGLCEGAEPWKLCARRAKGQREISPTIAILDQKLIRMVPPGPGFPFP